MTNHVHCDFKGCDESTTRSGYWETLNGSDYCPEHAEELDGWGQRHRSTGMDLAVTHQLKDSEFEAAAVSDDGGHGMSIVSTDDGMRIYIFDHLTIDISGNPKDNPTITIEEDEFPATLKYL